MSYKSVLLCLKKMFYREKFETPKQWPFLSNTNRAAGAAK